MSFVADYWVAYKSHRLQCGDTMATIPLNDGGGSDPTHSLNRLQLEFDQFVLGAIRWILTADKSVQHTHAHTHHCSFLNSFRLGVWQFLADMPYDSVSLATTWKIFWNIYCKERRGGGSVFPSAAGDRSRHGSVMTRETGPALLSPDSSPTSIDHIKEALKGQPRPQKVKVQVF